MIHTEQPAVNVSILGGFKSFLIVGVGIFAFIQMDPLSTGKSLEVAVSADSYPFMVPKALKDSYTGTNPQILLARSVWEFKIKNEGAKELANISIELPFSGSYMVQVPDAAPLESIPTFARQISIGNLAANQEARVTLWVGEELNPEFERMVQVRGGGVVLPVEYPVKASGLVAWVERYKTPLSLGLFVLFLVTFL